MAHSDDQTEIAAARVAAARRPDSGDVRFMATQQLAEWLASLLASRTLVAPRRIGRDLVLYRPVETVDDIAFDFGRTAVSPKEFFLPATETILTIERRRMPQPGADEESAPANLMQVELHEPGLTGDTVLFAVRACDAHALLSLDALLLREPADSYYARRREQTTLIGLACEEMAPSCFCTAVGFTPDDPSGLDLMLERVEDGYRLRILTEKGRELLGELDLPPWSGEFAPRVWPKTDYQVAPRALWTACFDDPFWQALGQRCLSCKLCAYVCPTCRCFDVRDYPLRRSSGHEVIERLRVWDACLSEGYRCTAGGHNPRPTRAERLRNRFFCKFVYYPQDFGPLACVGCGRCIDYCPVNIDITEVLTAVTTGGP